MSGEDVKSKLVNLNFNAAVETLVDAESLLRLNGSGRSIVNRAYYAAFYAAHAALETKAIGAKTHHGRLT